MLQCSLPTASHYPVVVWESVGVGGCWCGRVLLGECVCGRVLLVCESVGVGECWCGRVLVWKSVGTSVSEEHGDGEGSGE